MEGDGASSVRNDGRRKREGQAEAADLEANPGSSLDDDIEDGPGASLFSRLFGRKGKPALDTEIVTAIEIGSENPQRAVSSARREMIERVVAFDQKRVLDVMAPRADIVAVEIETPLDDVIRCFAEAGHSRLPVYRGDLDDPIGMAHIRDVVALIANPEEAKAIKGPVLAKIRRNLLYVPPSMRITDLLLRMQASRIHMALVIDEYGGTDGLVTIEDLVEEVVGDINDEHDDEEAPTLTPRAGGWDADARVELEEVRAATGVNIIAEDDEADTLGGLVVSIAGRVPQRGEVISHPTGLDFEVIEADARKIRKLRIRRCGFGAAALHDR